LGYLSPDEFEKRNLGSNGKENLVHHTGRLVSFQNLTNLAVPIS
jgi:hypothetical protein